VVFSSITFLVYFLPLLILLYVITPHRLRNPLLLLASILFYSWGAPRFIFVILGTTFLDFFLVKAMHASRNDLKRKAIMVLSICMNLGLLFYFKYCNFFIDNINEALSWFYISPMPILNVVLPIGISFYTFESLTYVIDVYRRVHAPLKNFWNYQLYIILFPKLIAGPIIRYHEIADQITDRRLYDNLDNKIAGLFRFSIGLAKKVFIANTMAVYADRTFNAPVQDLGAVMAWTGMLSYTFQIYFDFSGYSDMAIGLGRMFGFRFPENFNNPYTSQSITEFWRRWHITLGNWMRNYLYIPLGGNQVKTKSRLYFNLWFVFLASGFWHGASWTFIAWGAYHGAFLVMERIFLNDFYKKIPRGVATIITFFIVAVGWILFRADTISHATGIFRELFNFNVSPSPEYFEKQFLVFLTLAFLFSFFTFSAWGRRIQDKVFFSMPGIGGQILSSLASGILILISTAAIAATDFNPFIYFRF
jgi:alginate O-acetyltransferase complex protein AlgI